MKRIILLALCAFTSCTQGRYIHVLPDEELSSPNQPVYHFAISPCTRWADYHLITENSAGERNDWGLVCTDPLGNIVVRKQGIWHPFTLACCDYGPGEYIDAWFIKNGDELRAHIVPHPISITQHGYTLYLEKDDKLAYTWRVVGEGFCPGERVWVITYVGPRVHTVYMIASSEGQIMGGVEAWEEGKYTGETRMEFHAERGSLYLPFPWGNDWFKWRREFVAEKQKQDAEFRHSLIWSSDYQGHE